MREWKSPFNPFNSMKVLLWPEHLKGCATGNYLPPVTVDIDPTNRCNYDCLWCNAFDIMEKCKQQELSEEHLLKISDMCKDWGVNSACIAGGGEPLMNPATMSLLERQVSNGLENGLITNGSLLDSEKIKIIAKTCRWVGISMDAATRDTYNKVKGLPVKNDLFYKVVENINNLAREIKNAGTKNDLCYKYLLHPLNAHEIYQAAALAKQIGCRDFHLRPVGWYNLSKIEGQEMISYEGIESLIEDQMNKIFDLECDTFHVYGITHKFNPDFTPKKNFSRCWAIPILPTFGADGKVYLCFDMRGNQEQILCDHYPDPEALRRYWNSEAHHKLVESIDITKCPRCTFSAYNEAVEKVFIEDRMCHKFP